MDKQAQLQADQVVNSLVAVRQLLNDPQTRAPVMQGSALQFADTILSRIVAGELVLLNKEYFQKLLSAEQELDAMLRATKEDDKPKPPEKANGGANKAPRASK